MKIRKYIALASIVIATNAMLADNNVSTPDTLLRMDIPSKVVITENNNGSEIIISGTGGNIYETKITAEYSPESVVTSRQSIFENRDFSLFGNRKRKSGAGWDLTVDGVCLGLTKAKGLQREGLQWAKSIEIGWLNAVAVRYNTSRNLSFSLGIGFDWRNYKSTTSDKYLVPTLSRGIDWKSSNEDMNLKSTNLHIFSLQIPFLFRAHIPKTSLYVKAGPIFNCNTYASVKTIYDDKFGNKCEYFSKGIKPQRFTVDLFASISLCKAVGIYVRYSLMQMMDAVDGLNFKPLTVGVGIGI